MRTYLNFIKQTLISSLNLRFGFKKKKSEIDYLKSKKLDQKIGSNQMETISAVLNELERGLGLIE